jgi:hypothetical protein
LLAGVRMLFHDAGRVLDGHLVSGKRDEPASQLDMQSVQGRAPGFAVDRLVRHFLLLSRERFVPSIVATQNSGTHGRGVGRANSGMDKGVAAGVK